jgi:2-methylisoborneol synthase
VNHEDQGNVMTDQVLTSAATAATATALAVPLEAPPQRGCPMPADGTSAVATSTPVLSGPTGLGTAAARVVGLRDPGYGDRRWGDGTPPPLYTPVVERIDPALADEVEKRLIVWAADCGFTDDQARQMGDAGFGRLAMLAHPDVDDPDRLLIAAQLNAAWWAADDLYADDSAMGATPTELPPRLSLVMAAMDPVAPAGDFSLPLDEHLRTDPVLVALRSGIEHLARHGSPAQVQRACYATFAMFVSWNAYAAWRHTGDYPPAWEYLAARQHDSFYTSMTLVDPLAGYELPANLYYDPRVRQALMQAGTAAVMVNDLYSVAKDAADEKPVCNMVLQVAADRGVSVDEATEITVGLHNDLVRGFEATHRALRAVPSPELRLFLRGVQSWLAGGFEWHATNPRYQ